MLFPAQAGPQPGVGKRGGARVVIYYNPLDEGLIVLLIVYSKAKFDNLPTAFLNQLTEAISEMGTRPQAAFRRGLPARPRLCS